MEPAKQIQDNLDRELSIIIWKGVFENSFNRLSEIAANKDRPILHDYEDLDSAEYLGNCLFNIMCKSHQSNVDVVGKAIELLEKNQ